MSAIEMVKKLLMGHEEIIQSLRVDLESCGDKFHDSGTNDFLTGLMERHEKMAWMLRAVVE
ncbi:MAG: ferritin-like domain-containing protein [Nitrospira sp.]|nr:ferritin-like domain-containing protein [Nitrospira sp.]